MIEFIIQKLLYIVTVIMGVGAFFSTFHLLKVLNKAHSPEGYNGWVMGQFILHSPVLFISFILIFITIVTLI